MICRAGVSNEHKPDQQSEMTGHFTRIHHWSARSLRMLLPAFCLLFHRSLLAQNVPHEHDRDFLHADTARARCLHFSHPLETESVSPDTKIRLDYLLSDPSVHDHEDDLSGVFRIEAEYAFSRRFSVEAIVPIDVHTSEAGSEHPHVALKFASYELEKHHLLLGYGLEFGFPQAHGRHHSTWEIGPTLGIGYALRTTEIIALATMQVPVDPGEESQTEVNVNLSTLFHLAPGFQGLLELSGEWFPAGGVHGDSALDFSPGIKLRPRPRRDLYIGVGARLPISQNRVVPSRLIISAIHHF